MSLKKIQSFIKSYGEVPLWLIIWMGIFWPTGNVDRALVAFYIIFALIPGLIFSALYLVIKNKYLQSRAQHPKLFLDQHPKLKLFWGIACTLPTLSFLTINHFDILAKLPDLMGYILIGRVVYLLLKLAPAQDSPS